MTDNAIVDMVDGEVEDEVRNEVVSDIPSSTDPKWVEYILDQLSDHEMINGAPTTDGLRRVTEKVFGEILVSETDILLERGGGDGSREVTAKHSMTIRKYRESCSTISVSACVNVNAEKLPYPFKDHIVSTACTRAEGKALRRALKVRIYTAEELANTDEENVDDKTKITDQQILGIKAMCKRNDIDLIKFVKANSNKRKGIRDVANLESRLMLNLLSDFQREGVPEELVGYNDNWEEVFK